MNSNDINKTKKTDTIFIWGMVHELREGTSVQEPQTMSSWFALICLLLTIFFICIFFLL